MTTCLFFLFLVRKRVQKKFQKYTWSFGIDEAAIGMGVSVVNGAQVFQRVQHVRMMKDSPETASSWRCVRHCDNFQQHK